MNFSDIARLKFENIDGNKIVFLREKTSRTSRQNQRPVIVTLLPEAEGVILKWGNAIQAKGNYVFPILSTGLTPHQEKAKINLTISLVNNYIGKIAEAVGIEKKVTTYTARHCYSTMLKRSGVPIEFISESLGHKDIRTTESYLDSFEDKHREEFSKRLLEFGGEKSHA